MNSSLSFNELAALGRSELEVRHEISISVLGDSSTQFVVKALQGIGRRDGIKFEVYEAGFDQIEQEVLDPTSGFRTARHEFTLLQFSTEKLLHRFQHTPASDRADFALSSIDNIRSLATNIDPDVKIIVNTLPQVRSGVFGNYGAIVPTSFEFQLSVLNLEIKKLAMDMGNVFVCDIEQLQSQTGIRERIDSKFYYKAQLAYSLDFLPLLVENYLEIIKAIKGIELRKCLILDLDNTMWGGVIGDDGLEGIQIGNLGLGQAFDDVQAWALELKNRGIILCVCSKNTDSVAREPFEKHPDMTLRLDDISVFVANWENKADNIRHIQSVLNIGFDSMVFLDDNPFERNLVRQELPDVTVPELPEDPAEYITFLREHNLFETASHSVEDANRTKKYQEEAKRVATRQSYKSIDDYLESLDMRAVVEPFNERTVPRVSQLTQRSNQFNLRTIRYSEQDIQRLIASDQHVTMQISLGDKYGDYGVISLLVGEKRAEVMFVDTWIMSCRVLKRGVEKLALNQLVELARINGCNAIVGEFLPTAKNQLVESHYPDMGFQSSGDNCFVLHLNNFKSNQIKINIV